MEITFNKKRNSSLQVHDVLYYATVVNGVTTKPEVWGEIVDMYDLADHYDKLSTCMLSGSHSIEHKVFILILKDFEVSKCGLLIMAIPITCLNVGL